VNLSVAAITGELVQAYAAGRVSDGYGQLGDSFPTWEDFLRLAFDEIRYCGARSVQVIRRTKALVSDLRSRLPEDRCPALRHWEQRLQATIARSFDDNGGEAGGLGRRPARAWRASQAVGDLEESIVASPFPGPPNLLRVNASASPEGTDSQIPR
jgi:hypothetical protein